MIMELLNLAWVEHTDYYKYLLFTSWPAVSGLFVICLYFGFKLIRQIKKCLVPSAKSFAAAGKSLLITVLVVGSYSVMFTHHYPDWFLKPAVVTGIVEAVNDDQMMAIRSGGELYSVKASRHMVTRIKVDDEVEVVYLPTKLNAVKCKLLTQQAGKLI